jgi:hypothetical protein
MMTGVTAVTIPSHHSLSFQATLMGCIQQPPILPSIIVFVQKMGQKTLFPLTAYELATAICCKSSACTTSTGRSPSISTNKPRAL